ncbi:2006_t:CDS:2 [Entrophospora sp. SA101]|nr:2006_t:CDS:2 [Entrophospora sp. SA101]
MVPNCVNSQLLDVGSLDHLLPHEMKIKDKKLEICIVLKKPAMSAPSFSSVGNELKRSSVKSVNQLLDSKGERLDSYVVGLSYDGLIGSMYYYFRLKFTQISSGYIREDLGSPQLKRLLSREEIHDEYHLLKATHSTGNTFIAMVNNGINTSYM